jgi:hypothetical protein
MMLGHPARADHSNSKHGSDVLYFGQSRYPLHSRSLKGWGGPKKGNYPFDIGSYY